MASSAPSSVFTHRPATALLGPAQHRMGPLFCPTRVPTPSSYFPAAGPCPRPSGSTSSRSPPRERQRRGEGGGRAEFRMDRVRYADLAWGGAVESALSSFPTLICVPVQVRRLLSSYAALQFSSCVSQCHCSSVSRCNCISNCSCVSRPDVTFMY